MGGEKRRLTAPEIRRELLKRVLAVPGWSELTEADIRIFPPPDASSNWTAHIPHPRRHEIERLLQEARDEIDFVRD